MPGKHRGPTISFGPRFRRVRHWNRDEAGSRGSVMGSTILLLPEDDEEPAFRPPGRHRIRAATSHHA